MNDSQNYSLNNCYIECGENYYYFNSSNKYHCTDIKKCPDNYKLIKEKNKCIDNCTKDDEYHFEFNNSCLKECPANHAEINNICLKIPDTAVDTNLLIKNSESIVNTNLPIIKSHTVANTNLPIIKSDTAVDTNLPIINSDTIANTNLSIINSDTVANTNLPIINSDTVVDTNIRKININEKGECPKDFPYKLQNDRECVKECKASDIFNGIFIINNKDSTIKDDMINKTRNEIINHEMDELLKDVIGDKKEDLITVQGNAIYTLTT